MMKIPSPSWAQTCKDQNYPTIDKKVYAIYKVVKHFIPYLFKNHYIVYVPHPTVHTLLAQQELGEWRVN